LSVTLGAAEAWRFAVHPFGQGYRFCIGECASPLRRALEFWPLRSETEQNKNIDRPRLRPCGKRRRLGRVAGRSDAWAL